MLVVEEAKGSTGPLQGMRAARKNDCSKTAALKS